MSSAVPTLKGREGEGEMMDMMPHRSGIMFPKMPKGKRMEFVLKMVANLTEEGRGGMWDEEKKTFLGKVVATVNTQGPRQEGGS